MPPGPRWGGVSTNPHSLALAAYAAAMGLLEPFAPALLRGRARRGKEDAARLGERLGRSSRPRPEGALVWLHGVSIGESLSLLPLVEWLRSRRPDVALLITSGTTTSAALLASRLPAGVIHQYAPVDSPGAVRGFLDHWRPHAGLLVESELWPNLISQARARGVRLALLSARMTAGSARRWARAPAAARALLTAFDLVLPQDEATDRRLRRLGAVVGPRLNLKLVGASATVGVEALKALRKQVGDRKVVLAVSTHPGEESLIARAFREASVGGPPALLVVAVRHPDRGAAVAAELATAGFTVSRRSEGEPLAEETTAYVADTLGELGLLLSVADVAVMGGSFFDGIGGHNPMEPARLGTPVVTGPHSFNARDIYAEMFARVAALEAADTAALARHLRGLLTYPHIARRIGEAGLDYARSQGQALDAAFKLLDPLLPP